MIDGRRIRRSGFASRAEAQEELDASKHPAPAAAVVPGGGLTLGEGVTRYLAAKARKKSLAEDQRLAKHLKPSPGSTHPSPS